MRILFWNVRGLGKSYRRGLVKNHILQEDIDVVAIQETIKQNFEDWELKELAGNRDFCCHWNPSRGHSVGLVMGVNVQDFEIEDYISGFYFLRILVRNRITNFRFWIVNVYGPAQHEFSGDFVKEMEGFCSNADFPFIMGGDFNLIRNNKERNQGQGDPNLMDLFNEFIGNYQLREIYVSGVKFTWSNKQSRPTLIKLDRILASQEWDLHFGNCFAWSKPRVGSDHSPLILDTGEHREAKANYFFFEEGWLQHEEFKGLVFSKWSEYRVQQQGSPFSLDRWHGCLQSLRNYLRG